MGVWWVWWDWREPWFGCLDFSVALAWIGLAWMVCVVFGSSDFAVCLWCRFAALVWKTNTRNRSNSQAFHFFSGSNPPSIIRSRWKGSGVSVESRLRRLARVPEADAQVVRALHHLREDPQQASAAFAYHAPTGGWVLGVDRFVGNSFAMLLGSLTIAGQSTSISNTMRPFYVVGVSYLETGYAQPNKPKSLIVWKPKTTTFLSVLSC